MKREVFERLIAEEKELSDRIEKLTVFVESENYKKLNDENQYLLRRQLDSMKEYESILQRRIQINRFDKK
jgi:hypothetical protein